MTTCRILCRSPVCCQNSPEPSRHGLHSASEGVLGYLADPSGPVSCEVGGGGLILLKEATATREHRFHGRVREQKKCSGGHDPVVTVWPLLPIFPSSDTSTLRTKSSFAA